MLTKIIVVHTDFRLNCSVFCLRFHRALGTPNNDVWPEVESLQDYKNTFPKWKPGSLGTHVKNLDEDGLDLLSVSTLS